MKMEFNKLQNFVSMSIRENNQVNEVVKNELKFDSNSSLDTPIRYLSYQQHLSLEKLKCLENIL